MNHRAQTVELIQKYKANYPGGVFYHGKKNFGDIRACFEFHRSLAPVKIRYERSLAVRKMDYRQLAEEIEKSKAMILGDADLEAKRMALAELRSTIDSFRSNNSSKNGDITVQVN